MRIRVAVHWGNIAGTVALCLILAGVNACSANGFYLDPIEAAEPLVSMAMRADSKEGGRLTAHLRDGRVLEGNWAGVSESRPASAVVIRTPDGQISAEALSAPDTPFATAYLTGDGAHMICAIAGDALRGYSSHCAEGTGDRWVGLAWQHHLVSGYTTFHGDLSVQLTEKR